MVTFEEIDKSLKEKGRYWIAFTGDSITSCEWVHPNWREIVEYVLQDQMTNFLKGDWRTAEWGIRGFNFALDGATSADILQRVENIKSINPDLVIGLMGGNDPTFKISVEGSVKNINEVIKALDTKVVWCNSTSAGGGTKNAEYEPYARACSKIPETENLQIIDMFNIYKSFPLNRFFTFISEEVPEENIKAGDPDYQHPNQLGNAYIAKVILERVFGVLFDPEKYWKDTISGEKLPSY